ncbi:HAD family acid phosphatase, partial [Hyphomonas sp. ND6WE1B]
TQGQQWLYGSAESRIALKQDWNAIASYVAAKAANRPNTSVVLAPGATAEAADFLACDADQPLAAVFDADETLIWNLGSMGYFTRIGVGFDPAIWDEWEKTGSGKAVAIPGVKDAFKRIRDAGVEIIVNTNRSNANIQGSADTLKSAGLGEFAHGRTLYLRGDAPGGSGKDGRRYMISDDYCVIALAGDQLGDIADLFNDKALTPPERKALTAAPAFDPMWGNGWFILPNPVYGPSLAGSMEEVFPPETDWAPPPAPPPAEE